MSTGFFQLTTAVSSGIIFYEQRRSFRVGGTWNGAIFFFAEDIENGLFFE